MPYIYDRTSGQIVDAEDGQVIATMSDSATHEQGAALVGAYNTLQGQNVEFGNADPAPSPY